MMEERQKANKKCTGREMRVGTTSCLKTQRSGQALIDRDVDDELALS
jgi:hypothetical protein